LDTGEFSARKHFRFLNIEIHVNIKLLFSSIKIGYQTFPIVPKSEKEKIICQLQAVQTALSPDQNLRAPKVPM